MSTTIIHGDCLEELKKLEDNSVDAVVTDPPYGLSNTKPAQVADVLKAWVTGDTEAAPTTKGGFMNASWDSFVPPPAVWEECMRVLKPGGHMAVFAGARTQDLMGLSIRLAGFRIKDTLGWIFGSGFPKSMDVSKAIDKAAGAERKVVGSYDRRSVYDNRNRTSVGAGSSQCAVGSAEIELTAPASDAAKQWSGWGTQIKPAIEPIILAQKPLDGTVANNVLAHGVGGLNIDACRVGMSDADREAAKVPQPAHHHYDKSVYQNSSVGGRNGATFEPAPAGRFPANVLLDEHAAAEMDEQSGVLKSGAKLPHHVMKNASDVYGTYGPTTGHNIPADSGGASRFFPVFKYQAKAPKKERPVVEREDGSKIQHPTVKPLTLLEWLVELITPPNGTVLDPFAGSGTTLEAARNKNFHAIGIEQDADYIKLIEQRLAA